MLRHKCLDNSFFNQQSLFHNGTICISPTNFLGHFYKFSKKHGTMDCNIKSTEAYLWKVGCKVDYITKPETDRHSFSFNRIELDYQAWRIII